MAKYVTHTRNLCSAFNPSKCTHTAVNTHTVNTHPEQWAANAAAPGEQLGVQCLAQESHLSRGIKGGESAGYSLLPPTIPAGPESRTRDLSVTSPTLYPLGHDCPHYIFHFHIIYYIITFFALQWLLFLINIKKSLLVTSIATNQLQSFWSTFLVS